MDYSQRTCLGLPKQSPAILWIVLLNRLQCLIEKYLSAIDPLAARVRNKSPVWLDISKESRAAVAVFVIEPSLRVFVQYRSRNQEPVAAIIVLRRKWTVLVSEYCICCDRANTISANNYINADFFSSPQRDWWLEWILHHDQLHHDCLTRKAWAHVCGYVFL